MFDFLGEMGSSFPWFYRGLIYLISESYREDRRREWQRKGPFYKTMDIILTVVFFGAEVFLVFLLAVSL